MVEGLKYKAAGQPTSHAMMGPGSQDPVFTYGVLSIKSPGFVTSCFSPLLHHTNTDTHPGSHQRVPSGLACTMQVTETEKRPGAKGGREGEECPTPTVGTQGTLLPL